jgi:DNA replication protein DnaC
MNKKEQEMLVLSGMGWAEMCAAVAESAMERGVVADGPGCEKAAMREEQAKARRWLQGRGYDGVNLEKMATLCAQGKMMKRGDKGWYLVGMVGRGKTWSAELVADYMGRGDFESVRPGSCVIEATWFAEQWSSGINARRTMFRVMNSSKSMIVDDLGQEERVRSDGGDPMELAEKLVTARYRVWKKCGAPTIWTSNVGPRELCVHSNEEGEEISGRYDSRALSRFREMTRLQMLTGPDRRND